MHRAMTVESARTPLEAGSVAGLTPRPPVTSAAGALEATFALADALLQGSSDIVVVEPEAEVPRDDPLSRLVGRPGLEPGTLGLKVPCSSQMS
jgi:hypothetical protein